MTEPPVTIQGELLQLPSPQPSAILDPISMATHKFCNLMRTIIVNQHGILKSETEVNEALNIISTFEKHLIPQRDRALVGSPDDMAPREDVSQRVPPRGAAPVIIPSAGPAIDYNALAQAIITAQSQMTNPPAPEVRDDEPAGNDSTN